MKELVPIPGTPPFILGVVSVHGRILSVMDIRKFFDLPEKGLTELDKIIAVQSGKIEVAIWADVILGIRSIPMGEMQPPPLTFTGIRERYLKAITCERTAVLDMQKLLLDKSIIVHEEME